MSKRKRCAGFATAVLIGLAVSGSAEAVSLSLKKGFNLTAFPVDFGSPMTSHALRSVLGSALVSVGRIDASTPGVEETRFENATPSGADFPIGSGQGYLVKMTDDVSIEGLTGTTAGGGSIDVVAGPNLVAFLPVSHRLSAFRVLALLGGQGVSASLSRFDPRRGRFEAATRVNDTYSGVEFGITPVESYLFSTSQTLPGLSLPPLVFVRGSERHGVIADTFSASGSSATSTRYRLFDSLAQSSPIGRMQSTGVKLQGGFLPACCAALP